MKFNSLHWSDPVSAVSLTSFISLVFLLSSSCVAVDLDKELKAKRTISEMEEIEGINALCKEKPTPEVCSWTLRDVERKEQQIINKAIKKIDKIIMPTLKRAVWVSHSDYDTANPLIESYCTDKLNAIKEGRVKFFPKPQVAQFYPLLKTKSMARIWKYKPKGWEGKMNLLLSKETYSIHFDHGTRSTIFPTHSWPNFHPPTDEERRNAKWTRGIDDAGDGEPYATVYPDIPGIYYEYAYGLLEIEGDIFVIEGGLYGMTMMRKSNGQSIWLMDEFEMLVWAFFDDAARDERVLATHEEAQARDDKFWLSRVLALYPLDYPWGDFYRQLGIPHDELQGIGGWHYEGRPCMWAIASPDAYKERNGKR